MSAFSPFVWQLEPWRDTSPVILCYGGAGSGKSVIAAEKIHALAKRYPESTGLIVRKMRESMSNSTILYYDTQVVAGDPGVRHHKSAHRFEYSNGSVVTYGGMKDKQQREAIRSIGLKGGLDWVWEEEANALTWEDHEELTTRMRGQAALKATGKNFTQMILTTNPDSEKHWINQKLILEKLAKVYFAKPEDNPLATEEYINKLKSLTGVRYRRFYKGEWATAEGVIFEDYDPNVHIIPRFDIPKEWRRIRVVDFGFVHAFCCQWWAINPDGDMFRYKEIYKTKTLVQDHAKRIIKLTGTDRIENTICDHDAEDRATLEKAGIRTIPAYKTVTRGIQAVQDRFRFVLDRDGNQLPGRNGKPRTKIYFLDGSLDEADEELMARSAPYETTQEFTSYVWKKGADGRPNKEEPIKEFDEGSDCTRYAVAYVDNLVQTGDPKKIIQSGAQVRSSYTNLVDQFGTSWK